MGRLSIVQSQAATELAEFLRDFLPGKAHPYADQSISFAGVAHKMGVAQYWIHGSKGPALAQLLEKTLEHRAELFCGLVEEIVKTSMKYPKKGVPLREEIETLNGIVQRCGFKIPALWDPAFLRGLPSPNPAPRLDLDKLRPKLLQKLIALQKLDDKQQARGYSFEGFLNELFTAYGLNPRDPFKLTGEQIDGSLDVNGNTYLIEARWRNNQANNADLLVFHGKVDGKASWSRGIFISYSGFTADGLEAFRRGRSTSIIAITGEDLYFVLEGKIGLEGLVEAKARRAAEEGLCYVPAYQIAIM